MVVTSVPRLLKTKRFEILLDRSKAVVCGFSGKLRYGCCEGKCSLKCSDIETMTKEGDAHKKKRHRN